MGSSPSLNHYHLSPFFFHIFISHLSLLMALTRLRSDCQVSRMLITEPAPHASHLSHPPCNLLQTKHKSHYWALYSMYNVEVWIVGDGRVCWAWKWDYGNSLCWFALYTNCMVVHEWTWLSHSVCDIKSKTQVTSGGPNSIISDSDYALPCQVGL